MTPTFHWAKPGEISCSLTPIADAKPSRVVVGGAPGLLSPSLLVACGKRDYLSEEKPIFNRIQVLIEAFLACHPECCDPKLTPIPEHAFCRAVWNCLDPGDDQLHL